MLFISQESKICDHNLTTVQQRARKVVLPAPNLSRLCWITIPVPSDCESEGIESAPMCVHLYTVISPGQLTYLL